MSERLTEFLRALGVTPSESMQSLGLRPFLLILLLSVAAALFVTYLYVHFYSSRASGSYVYLSFPLLGLSITAIFICIQFSLPLSLGLLGALSIVRFRTPIKEPEEIGFVMLLIATSLACATFNLLFLVAILAVATAALLLRGWAPGVLAAPSHDGTLLLTFAADDYDKKGRELLDFVDRRLRRGKVESVTRADGNVAISIVFRGAPPKGLLDVEAELRSILAPTSLAILYNRPGAL